MLMLARAIKLLSETALLLLAAQGLLALLAGGTREANPVYRLLRLLTAPVLGLARRLLPQRWQGRQLGWGAALGLLLIWAAASFWKLRLCLQQGLAHCQ